MEALVHTHDELFFTDYNIGTYGPLGLTLKQEKRVCRDEL